MPEHGPPDLSRSNSGPGILIMGSLDTYCCMSNIWLGPVQIWFVSPKPTSSPRTRSTNSSRILWGQVVPLYINVLLRTYLLQNFLHGKDFPTARDTYIDRLTLLQKSSLWNEIAIHKSQWHLYGYQKDQALLVFFSFFCTHGKIQNQR